MEKAESDTIGGRILMLNIKRFLCLILAAVLCVGLFTASVSAADSVPGLAHFAKSRIWSDDLFADVSASDWFYGNVRSVYEYGLMIGKGENLFDPAGNVTLAETLTIAARLHAIYAAACSLFIYRSDFRHFYENIIPRGVTIFFSFEHRRDPP